MNETIEKVNDSVIKVTVIETREFSENYAYVDLLSEKKDLEAQLVDVERLIAEAERLGADNIPVAEVASDLEADNG